ncbi:MAG: type I phosphomannose isomerase catalytic subunit [Bacteroidales bacterium]
MENSLYPLKFTPIVKDKIWGGSRLRDVLKKEASETAGESWEISGVEGDLSVVANGFLAGNNLQEVMEVYMGDLLGEQVYDRFGLTFPLLIKFIDAADYLSIQVHPGDDMALERHKSFGKTEMWYILASEEGKLVVGFNRDLDKESYGMLLREGQLPSVMNVEDVKPGDIYFIPAGRVHAIGPGVLLAEIQQTSDITYRMYDWDRTDASGKGRELHTDQALDAIDFKRQAVYKTPYATILNSTVPAVTCPYFNTSVIRLDQPVEKDYNLIDSFVIYLCTEGGATIAYPGGTVSINKGETVLIPNELKNLTILPRGKANLLEVYIP